MSVRTEVRKAYDHLGSELSTGYVVSPTVGRYKDEVGVIIRVYETGNKSTAVRVMFSSRKTPSPFLPKYLRRVATTWQ